jgi:WD40 repeat protein/tRNA A-37 threonylcarbamoyl transferase component Bud32
MLQPGFQLGKYRIIRSIGTGGFATVYLGEHIYLKTKAAVKVLHLDTDIQQKDIGKFLQEAQTIALLKHSHIVSILDFGVEEGIPCLVMDYAPNGSVSARHKGQPILDSKLVLSYTMQVAEALQFAHDHKVIHCDIKPENMLLDEKNKVLLSDFGIAVIMHSNFKMSNVMGTMQYMPPEQFSGQPVAASDQYALAVSIYRWLCGRFPFDGLNPIEVWHRQMNGSPHPLSQVNPQISHEVEQVIFTALAKDPDQRFDSIRGFVSSLERAMQAQHVLPSTMLTSASTVRQPQEEEVVSDEPSMLLPSFISLLPPLLPTPSLPIEDTREQAHDKTPVEAPWWSEIVGIPDDGARLRPESPLSPPVIPTPETATKTYSQHTAWVSAIAWSPDGKRLASASWDKTVHIWDAANCKTLLVYRGHTQPVKSVAWSPNGDYIASGGWDNSVQIWDTEKGIPLPDTYQHKAQIEAVVGSPNGVYIASAGHDCKVQVWRAADQYTFFVYEGHKGPIWSIAWSPDGKYIASASHDKTVQVWEALTGKQIQVYYDHNRQVATVSWCYDGHLLASGDRDGWVHVWSKTDGNMVLNYRDAVGAVKALSWSPRSMYLASAVKSVQIWHLTTTLPTAPYFTYTGHTDWVNALSWSPDGRQIATTSDDKTVQVWDVR